MAGYPVPSKKDEKGLVVKEGKVRGLIVKVLIAVAEKRLHCVTRFTENRTLGNEPDIFSFAGMKTILVPKGVLDIRISEPI
jgi:hypothetical protein